MIFQRELFMLQKVFLLSIFANDSGRVCVCVFLLPLLTQELEDRQDLKAV